MCSSFSVVLDRRILEDVTGVVQDDVDADDDEDEARGIPQYLHVVFEPFTLDRLS